MCLIIQKPAGTDVPRWIVESAQEYNRDGVGVMSAGRAEKWLRIGTGKLLRHINALGDCAVHFRMATHGAVAHQNAHPFKLANGGWLMHNGILHEYAPLKKFSSDSDTARFCKFYVDAMLAERGALDLAAIAHESLGSALAIMQGTRIDLTGDSWVEHEGLKLSNTYAWDAPAHLQSKWSYDIHGDDDADGARFCDAGADQGTAVCGWWDKQMRQHEMLPLSNEDRAAELEDMLASELIARVDELDFTDSRLQQHGDARLLSAVLCSELDGADFIERADARTLIELRLQLERRA